MCYARIGTSKEKKIQATSIKQELGIFSKLAMSNPIFLYGSPHPRRAGCLLCRLRQEHTSPNFLPVFWQPSKPNILPGDSKLFAFSHKVMTKRT